MLLGRKSDYLRKSFATFAFELSHWFKLARGFDHHWSRRDQLSPARTGALRLRSRLRRYARFPGLGGILPTEEKVIKAFVRLGRVLDRRRRPTADVEDIGVRA